MIWANILSKNLEIMKSNVADMENPKNMPKLPPTEPMKSCYGLFFPTASFFDL